VTGNPVLVAQLLGHGRAVRRVDDDRLGLLLRRHRAGTTPRGDDQGSSGADVGEQVHPAGRGRQRQQPDHHLPATHGVAEPPLELVALSVVPQIHVRRLGAGTDSRDRLSAPLPGPTGRTGDVSIRTDPVLGPEPMG
jgi:hypothetical protein